MSIGRLGHSATLLSSGKVLVAGSYPDYNYYQALASAELYDPTTDRWSAVGSMSTGRYSHSATLLPNGKVLVAGGARDNNNNAITNAELYDPDTGSWSAAGSLITGRYSHSATLLHNGKVLVAAGGMYQHELASAELYDPEVNSWSVSDSPPMFTDRSYHSATLLPNGRVLVAGGQHVGASSLASAELYDQSAVTNNNKWSTSGILTTKANNFSATLLHNGKVLMAGGLKTPAYIGDMFYLTRADIYDPDTDSITAAAPMAYERYLHTATILSSGKVLVVGGNCRSGNLARAEVYDPATNNWSSAGSMAFPRASHSATLLPNGKVLVAGGYYGQYVANEELYDPATNSWSSAGATAFPRSNHSATLLPNGKVLVIGGNSSSAACESAELYDPITNSWSSAGKMISKRWLHSATLLSNGKVLVAGGASNGYPSPYVELYDLATNSWSTASSMSIARRSHSATLLSNGKVLVAGGGYSGGTELYDPTTNSWSAAGSLAFPRSGNKAILLNSGKVMVLDMTIVNAGNYERIGKFEFYDPTIIDTIPPAIVPTITGPLVNGWYTDKVTVALAATDDVSGVKTVSYAIDGGAETVVQGATATFDFFGDGLRKITYGAIDNANNPANGNITIPIDTTPPTFTQIERPQPNASGWYNGNVTVHFSAIDALSGLASLTPDTVVTTEGPGQTVTGTAVDVAGNQSSYSVTGINVDKTAPVITIAGITNGATYNLGLVPQASFTAVDGLSGVAASSCALNGGDAQGLGQFTYTVTTIDKAGNTAITSVSYTVNATPSGTVTLIGTLPLDSQTVTTLSNSLATALEFYMRGNSTAGDEKMGAFINQVNAPGQNIPPEIVTMLINAANYIIANN